jgi:lipoprotein-releasing system permease protein
LKKLIYIASRYLFFKNKKQAINILSFITMFAMACGTGALLVILSTFNGFDSLSRNLNESFQPDLTILPKKNKQFEISDSIFDLISKQNNIAFVSKILEEKVYIQYQKQETIASIKGVDNTYFKTNRVSDFIVAGDSILENENYSFALLGVGVAQKLNINLDNQFEQLSIFYPKAESNSTLSLTDNFERNYITPGGVFSIFQDYDDKYVLVPLSFVQSLQQSESTMVSSLEIKLKNSEITSSKNEIQKILGDKFIVKNKLELNASFYKISRIEKMVVFFILVFVLIILSFNFIGSLTMHIIEKNRDIHILHYLGLKPIEIFKLYIIYGMMQGLLGGVIGLILGTTICIIQQLFGIVPMPGSGTFVVSAYPVQISAEDVFMILLILIFVSALASIYPAMRARKVIEND